MANINIRNWISGFDDTKLGYVYRALTKDPDPRYDTFTISGGAIQRAYHKNESCGDIDIYGYEGAWLNINCELLTSTTFVSSWYCREISKKIHLISHGRELYEFFDFSINTPQLYQDGFRIASSVQRQIETKKGVRINWKHSGNSTKQRYMKYFMQGYRFRDEDNDKMIDMLKNNIDLGESPIALQLYHGIE